MGAQEESPSREGVTTRSVVLKSAPAADPINKVAMTKTVLVTNRRLTLELSGGCRYRMIVAQTVTAVRLNE